LRACDRKASRVAGFAQRLGGHGPHLPGLETGQAFAETRQAVPAPLHGIRSEVARLVQTASLAHRLLQVFDPADLAVLVAADFQPEAVGSEIDRGQQGTVVHNELLLSCGPEGGRDASYWTAFM